MSAASFVKWVFSLTDTSVEGSRYVWGSGGREVRYATRGLTPEPQPPNFSLEHLAVQETAGSHRESSRKTLISSRFSSPLHLERSERRTDRYRDSCELSRPPCTPPCPKLRGTR